MVLAEVRKAANKRARHLGVGGHAAAIDTKGLRPGRDWCRRGPTAHDRSRPGARDPS